jgi:hypothetical protein
MYVTDLLLGGKPTNAFGARRLPAGTEERNGVLRGAFYFFFPTSEESK